VANFAFIVCEIVLILKLKDQLSASSAQTPNEKLQLVNLADV
jgi:hypothetical protein